MNKKLIVNDLKRNKMINLALLLFMVLSVSLVSLSVIIGTQTFTSITKLNEIAQPPHFLQMHKGPIDEQKIDEFVSSYEGTTYWQPHKMINVYGENITIVNSEYTYTMSDTRLDIGLVKQNESKDLLLDVDHHKIILDEGEIGMPMLLKDRYNFELGDKVLLSDSSIEKEFIITEFVVDAQMNSSMTSSTRILLSDQDYDALYGQFGEIETIIEVYFTDSSMASTFQSHYENAGLPQNGPAVTYSIMFLLSAITGVALVFLLFMMSVLLIIISFMSLRFTILATLEEEVMEIGTMKAIGLTFEDIRDIYLQKVRALALGATLIGTMLSLVLSTIFNQSISNTFGNSGLSPWTFVLSFIAALGVYFLIILYTKSVLKRIKKLTVVDALVAGNSFDKNEERIHDGLQKTKFEINWSLALREVFTQFKKWAIVFVIVLLSTLIILIPINLLSTFDDPQFITYMGSSLEDILIEVETGEDLETNYLKVKEVLNASDEIENYYEYKRINVTTIDIDGELSNLHIDTGFNSGNDLQYLSGVAPLKSDEIAISYLNAEKLGKEVNDTIPLTLNNIEHVMEISGIYQDVTNGGYTAKSSYEFENSQPELYSFSISLDDSININETADDWQERIGPGVSVNPMKEVINQTLGGVAAQIRNIVIIITIVGITVVVLISVLFLKLRLTRDHSRIAILKTIGFSEGDINLQYLIKMGIVSLSGVLVGLLLSNLIGERLINLGLSVSGLGIKEVTLLINPFIQYLLLPIVLMSVLLLVTRIVLSTVKHNSIIALMYK